MEMAIAIDSQPMTEEQRGADGQRAGRFRARAVGAADWIGEGHTLESDVAPLGYEVIFYRRPLPHSAHTALPQQYGDR